MNKIFFLTPKEALNCNYSFLDAKIFPRISNVQNYLLAKNILNSSINYDENLPKKIFITTNREDRISNIKELNSYLIKDNFNSNHLILFGINTHERNSIKYFYIAFSLSALELYPF